MSVGAGSIKRAARTAKKGDEAAVIIRAEAEVMETEAGMAMQGSGSAATPETAGVMETVRETEEAADKASDKKEKQKKSEKEKKSGALKKSETLKKTEASKKPETPKKPGKKAARPSVSAEDKNISKKPGSHEAYGIGQQLPTYLL